MNKKSINPINIRCSKISNQNYRIIYSGDRPMNLFIRRICLAAVAIISFLFLTVTLSWFWRVTVCKKERPLKLPEKFISKPILLKSRRRIFQQVKNFTLRAQNIGLCSVSWYQQIPTLNETGFLFTIASPVFFPDSILPFVFFRGFCF